MGHYWSEMQHDAPPRNPEPLLTMNFHELGGNMWYLYVHTPCRQVFHIQDKNKLPDSIWRHGRECI